MEHTLAFISEIEVQLIRKTHIEFWDIISSISRIWHAVFKCFFLYELLSLLLDKSDNDSRVLKCDLIHLFIYLETVLSSSWLWTVTQKEKNSNPHTLQSSNKQQ